MIKQLPLPPPPPPPPPPDTITVTTSFDYRGTAQLGINNIEFEGFDFARAIFSSTQFGTGLISDAVAITGDNFRNFIDIHLTNGDTSFSAAAWTFSNFIPFSPFQNDQVNIFGSAASDSITGSIMADGLIGQDGDDTLSGLDGRDYLIGGNGIDTLIGGTGDDAYRLEDVHSISELPLRFDYDTVVEGADGGIDTIEVYRAGIFGSYQLADNVENGVVFGPGSFTLSGNGLANQLTGNADANTLSGQDGQDVLRGLAGDDTLEGGRGGDTMDGGDGSDTASYARALSAVSVSLAIDGPQTTGAGFDTLLAIENLFGSAFGDKLRGDDEANVINGAAGGDIIAGAGGDDVLLGGNGGDTISGGQGADMIVGGAGKDQLSGGFGPDQFIFGPGSGVDTIRDFTDTGGLEDDTIDVSKFGFDNVSDFVKIASGNDLILDFGSGNRVVITDYLATHGAGAINDDILLFS